VVCLETPQNRCGGIPLTVYLAEVADLAAARGIPVHLDGARIFNAALALGTTADHLAAWIQVPEVRELERAVIVDVGLQLHHTQPPTGHVPPIPVEGPLRH
jgi:hypothetical protein